MKSKNFPLEALSKKRIHCSQNLSQNKPRNYFSTNETSVFENKTILQSQVCKIEKISKYKKVFLKACYFSVPVFIVIILFVYKNTSIFKKEETLCLTPECINAAYKILKEVNFSHDPCKNFYNYVCANWKKKHSRFNNLISPFEVAEEKLLIQIRDIIESIGEKSGNEALIKAKNFYLSCLKGDKHINLSNSILKLNIDTHYNGWPVTNSTWETSQTIEDLIIDVRATFFLTSLLPIYYSVDDRNSSENVIQIFQPSFLMAREDFLSKHSSKKQKAFLRLMIEASVLFGAKRDYAVQEMTKVFAFVKNIAKLTSSKKEKMNYEKLYRKMSIKALSEEVPKINWLKLFKKMFDDSITENELIVTYALDFLKKYQILIENTEKRVIYNYFLFLAIDSVLKNLKSAYNKLRNDFERAVQGSKAQQVRWAYCVEITNIIMGLAITSPYVESHFSDNKKKKAENLVRDIRTSFAEILNENTWMDEETKAIALEKVNEIIENIGYPEELTNSTLVIDYFKKFIIYPDKYAQNLFNYYAFIVLKEKESYGQTVDRKDWSTIPTIINAFYDPNRNAIIFPAGILNPPFFNTNFPKSINYGSIGTIIGHEITHGFDSIGRAYDKHGNLKNWWKNLTLETFEKKTECMINQYSSFIEPTTNKHCDGKLTLTENIADNGGLKAAYRAFKNWEKRNGEELLLPGVNLTNDQIFFISFAMVFCENVKMELAEERLLIDPHSPSLIRILGCASNSVDFSKAFKCDARSPMNPVKKCEIW